MSAPVSAIASAVSSRLSSSIATATEASTCSRVSACGKSNSDRAGAVSGRLRGPKLWREARFSTLKVATRRRMQVPLGSNALDRETLRRRDDLVLARDQQDLARPRLGGAPEEPVDGSRGLAERRRGGAAAHVVHEEQGRDGVAGAVDLERQPRRAHPPER